MKNREFASLRLQKVLEKSLIIMFIILVIAIPSAYNNYTYIKNYNYDINKMESQISDKKQRLEDLKKYDSSIKDTNWINYDLWLRNCAAVGNLSIYDNTNNLKLLSEKTQEELNQFSIDYKIVKENKDYGKIVKFIIIDKSRGTFLTNDIDNMKYIANKIKIFSQENGELYSYVSGKGKWFNITYDSGASPANKVFNPHYLSNANNFVEAYWFPKNYSYSKEEDALIRGILEEAKGEYDKEITSVNQYIDSIKGNISSKKILMIVEIAIIIAIFLTFLFAGKEKLINGFKENYLVKFVKIVDHWFEERATLFKAAVFAMFTLSVIATAVLILRYGFRNIFILWMFFYLIVILPKAIKFCIYIDEIMHGIDKITSGDIEYVIKEKEDRALSKLAFNINKLNRGFKVSIEDQIKNEKLKSELVANVSHDLKTPLTSIINYTDILLREEISEEEKEEFLKILNRKSLKLKKLIEDLFEISKINSGKVDLNKGTVDIVELVDQSIAEYSDTEIYLDKNLTFVIKPYANNIEMDLDGKKMSTVFENLINNALKYSLRDTRVFVDIVEIGKGTRICFKNISSMPLDFDREEIFERFTRGDKSRNSNIDGSGLGLAIARSIVELHGGIMYIDFDGDLFKVIIELYH